LFIIVEQFNTAPTSDYSKVTAWDVVRIQAPPSDATVLRCFLVQVWKDSFETQIDAMIIAQNISYHHQRI
jgi:hypothetical protein